jgi:NADPH:quinone reductase-like Zn-dependent oxidoreductase
VPGAGQVLIEVAGTSFNPADAAIRAGYMRDTFPLTLPHVPGFDVAGTIVELGPAVTGHEVGDEVMAFLPMTAPGATAEFALAPANLLAPAPAPATATAGAPQPDAPRAGGGPAAPTPLGGVSLADAAALPAAALTAWQAVHEHGAVRAGQTVLVVGAGGAVGRYAVQFAKLAGATVFGTAGPHSLDAARSAGADRVFDYTADKPDQQFDLVFNTARADLDLAPLVRPGGLLLSITSPAPATPGIRAENMYVRSDAAQLTEISALVAAGRVTVQVTDRRPFADLAEVHRAAEAGTLHGKTILTP